ncbi:hypothetical protein [Siphonobacter aquaeclarae]|uniref:Outer membrane protein beta-barrel domain-containing protein n=1 Tax=Siphonobacter aquaeclarae TaxID=563176 RepID=A0A1G9TJJ3_9BACT|nr:hypothetical protein [Siphonobacter aquaeclarae]SDM47830.1 hypothetical protein SAMN04488090_3584 [Siphonobacter aquaeclarae]
MKYLFLFFCVLAGFSCAAQEVPEIPEYYSPVKSQRLKAPRMEEEVLHRWYVNAEGFIRTDNSTLSNTFNDLISSGSVNKSGWGVLVGYSFREVWAAEAGYSPSPIHNQLTISNSPRDFVFTYKNDSRAIIGRVKRQLFSTGRVKNRSGFWISGGAWLIPNAGTTVDGFEIDGYLYKRGQQHPDTVQITSLTKTATSMTALLELGLEYNVRLSNRLGLGFYYRHLWGMGNSMSTHLTYTVNHANTTTSDIKADGSGWSLGLSLRYTYSLKRDIRGAYGGRSD